jgi:hypothetical protein
LLKVQSQRSPTLRQRSAWNAAALCRASVPYLQRDDSGFEKLQFGTAFVALQQTP